MSVGMPFMMPVGEVPFLAFISVDLTTSHLSSCSFANVNGRWD